MLNLNGKLPYAVLVAIALQTATAIWWAAGVTAKQDIQGETIKELKINVAALTTAKVVVLEAEVARLQAELAVVRLTQRAGK